MTSVSTPFTCIDNNVILNMADIGVYGFAVYAAIKMHLNQATGACFPSYATIARMTGINRSTVIEYVKRLRAKGLVDPRHRFKEDGSFTSNQYNFQAPGKPGYSNKIDPSTKTQGTENSVPSGSRPVQPKVVASNIPSSRPEPPEPNEENKRKKENLVNNELTEKQKTCPHPTEEISYLSDNTKVCHHCWTLLNSPNNQDYEEINSEVTIDGEIVNGMNFAITYY